MCSPRQARLNALRGFFHTQFAVEISAKYYENPTSGFALRSNILLLSIKYHGKNVISETIPIGNRQFELIFGHYSEALYPITQHKVPIGKNVISETTNWHQAVCVDLEYSTVGYI